MAEVRKAGECVRSRPGLRTPVTQKRRGNIAPHSSALSKTPPKKLSNHSPGQDQYGDSSDLSDTSERDEVDRSTNSHSTPRLYPDLASHLGPSYEFESHEDFISCERTQCRPRPSIRAGRRAPVTPEKGSPMKSHDPNLAKRVFNYWNCIKCIIILVILVIISVLFFNLRETDDISKPNPTNFKSIEEVYEDLQMSLKTMNRQFSQPQEVWIQILGQVRSVLVDEPQQPAVLLVVVPEDSVSAATCFTHTLANAIKDAFEDRGFVMYDVHSSSLDDPTTLQEEMEKALQGLAEAHTAIIHNIEEVPGSAAMMFHAYCDNENAPYKQAVLMLVLEVSGHYQALADSWLDEMVTTRLNQLWGSQLQEKDLSAIISRVANAPILIKPEQSNKLLSICGTP